MPPTAKNIVCALVVSLASVGCTTTMDLEYAFQLEQQTSESPLEFADENFAFTFQAVPSGVFFTVRNLSDTAAYIDWENCFFVEPSGNTFNALNTDILDESNEISRRSAHRTQVPVDATVSRFTTSTVNTQESNLVTVNEVGSMLSTTSINWTPTAGWGWNATKSTRTSASYAGSLMTASRGLWSARQYWPQEVSAASGAELVTMQRLTDEVRGQVSMGLGVRLVHGEKVLDYRFDFALAGIFASGKVQTNNPGETERRLRYFALQSEGWTWRPGEEHGEPLAAEAKPTASPAPEERN